MLLLKTFAREDMVEGDEVKTMIKVTNTKLNSCTYWTMVKFEHRLTQMKDLFQVTDIIHIISSVCVEGGRGRVVVGVNTKQNSCMYWMMVKCEN